MKLSVLLYVISLKIFAPRCHCSFLNSLRAILVCNRCLIDVFCGEAEAEGLLFCHLGDVILNLFLFISYIMAQGNNRSTKMEVLYKVIQKEVQ